MLDTDTRAPSSERARLIEALIEVAAERGYADTSVEAVVARAGLEQEAFDRHFRDKANCFVVAWQEINEECMAAIMEAYNSQRSWPDRLRAVATEVVTSLGADRSRARFAVEVLAMGHAARARRDMTMRVVASLIDAGRFEMADPDAVPHTTAEALAGSAYGQIYAKALGEDPGELTALVPQLMAAVVLPYLGLDASLEELQREVADPDPQLRTREMSKEMQDTAAESQPDYPPELARLPPGRHGLPREFVARNHRERLIAGLAEAVAEKGYAGATISDITRHATVSRRTFYEHFANKDECFVAAYEIVMEELRERVARAAEEEEDWPRAIRAGIAAMLTFLATEQSLARLSMVEGLVAGPIVVERYDAAIRSFVPYFRSGRAGRSPEVLEQLSPTTEEALVGGMISLISRWIIAERTAELEALLPDLVEFALTPYLGGSEAAEVARSG